MSKGLEESLKRAESRLKFLENEYKKSGNYHVTMQLDYQRRTVNSLRSQVNDLKNRKTPTRREKLLANIESIDSHPMKHNRRYSDLRAHYVKQLQELES